MDRDPALLVDMLVASRDILEFTEGVTESTFRDDAKTQAAVLYQLTVIGEAVRQLSSEFREEHPDIPWSKMIALRNFITHEYRRVDLGEVWRVVSGELAPLISKLERLVPPPPDA